MVKISSELESAHTYITHARDISCHDAAIMHGNRYKLKLKVEMSGEYQLMGPCPNLEKQNYNYDRNISLFIIYIQFAVLHILLMFKLHYFI